MVNEVLVVDLSEFCSTNLIRSVMLYRRMFAILILELSHFRDGNVSIHQSRMHGKLRNSCSM